MNLPDFGPTRLAIVIAVAVIIAVGIALWLIRRKRGGGPPCERARSAAFQAALSQAK
jgi:hypothetical protein